MRPHGTAKYLERRRRRAMALRAEGFTIEETARRVGSSMSSVKRWEKARRERGEHGLDPKPHPGAPRKLSPEQSGELVDLLAQGALAHGWPTDLWTCPRIVVLIERHFGVSYHEDHIGRLLRRLGWTPQRPQPKAKQRDEALIEQWKRLDAPRIKKTPGAGRPGASTSTSRASRSRPG